MKTYQAENTDLLKTILSASFFRPWKNREKYRTTIERRDLAVELYVTAACNQACEYCYLHKFGDALYPADIRDPEKIIHNLRMILDYLIEQGYDVRRYDIFSGEIMHTPLGIAVLDEIYQGKQRGLTVEEIQIPTNCSFLLDDAATQRLQAAFDRLRSAGVAVKPSASVDGLLIEDDVRPFVGGIRQGQRDQAFYDRVFDFVLKNEGGFHPMIAASSIERWKDNIVWWWNQCEAHGINLPNSVMTLEVRNDDWTLEKIEAYVDFLDFYAGLIFDGFCHGDAAYFARCMIGVEQVGPIRGYSPLLLNNDTQIATCSISHQLTVRLGDLAICPCHRTAYPEYLYGRFVVEDGKITDIEAINPFAAAKILMMNQRVCHHGCDVCWNKNFCVRQCFGAQLESGQELFMPSSIVCNLLKAKTEALYKIYLQYGVAEQAKLLVENTRDFDSRARKQIEIFIGLFDELKAAMEALK